MNQARHAGQKEFTAQLSDRIVLSRLGSERLAVLLNNVMGDYGSRFGALEVEPRRGAESPVQ
jgi:hypothetical protein